MAPTHRRRHTKSRNGCTECKRRKCKCDEQAPVCFNCRRYGVECSLGAATESGDASGSQSSTPLTGHLGVFTSPQNSTSAGASPGGRSSSLGISTSATTGSSLGLGAVLGDTLGLGIPSTMSGSGDSSALFGLIGPSSLSGTGHLTSAPSLFPPPSRSLLGLEPWSRDAELMHHYCTFTADSMAIREDMRHLWRVVKPRDGYEHGFIMHILLALAAVHKAHLMPAHRQTYLNASAHHQVLGSEEFRYLLQDVNASMENVEGGCNWRPIFCFSTCIVAYYLSQPVRCSNGRLEQPLLNTLDFLGTLRGIRATIDPFTPMVMVSEYAPGLYGLQPPDHQRVSESGPLPNLDQSPLPVSTFAALYDLRNVLEVALPPNTLPAYVTAISALQTSARHLAASGGSAAEPGAVLFWPAVIPEAVFTAMKAHEAPALLVLAHFAVFWVVLEPNFWFTRGWARGLVEAISATLATAESSILQSLAWPMEQVAMLAV